MIRNLTINIDCDRRIVLMPDGTIRLEVYLEDWGWELQWEGMEIEPDAELPFQDAFQMIREALGSDMAHVLSGRSKWDGAGEDDL